MTFDVVFGVIFVEVTMCTTAPGCAASSLPIAKLVPITGIVAVVSSPSVPAIDVRGDPAWPSLKMIAADAPAACAFSALSANGHVPRCMSATLPAGKPAKSLGLAARGRAVGRGAGRQHEVDRRERARSRRPSRSSSSIENSSGR